MRFDWSTSVSCEQYGCLSPSCENLQFHERNQSIHTSLRILLYFSLLSGTKNSTASRFFTNLLSNSPKRSPRFSPGYESTENMFYFFKKHWKSMLYCFSLLVPCRIYRAFCISFAFWNSLLVLSQFKSCLKLLYLWNLGVFRYSLCCGGSNKVLSNYLLVLCSAV